MLERDDIYRNEKIINTIARFCNDRKETYFTSDCFKALKSRIRTIDDAIDLNFQSNESFIAEIAPPVVRKDYLDTMSFLTKYFETDPLSTAFPVGGTSKRNADNITTLIHANYVNTKYRINCLARSFDKLARHGTCVTFSQYNDRYRGAGLKTERNDATGATSPYQRVPVTGQHAVENFDIHPLNYFQSAGGNTLGCNHISGFIDQWYVFSFHALKKTNDERYYQPGLEKIIGDFKKGHKDEKYYNGNFDREIPDFSRSTINVDRMWVLLNFEGNEGDDTIYYVEMVGDKVIRCEPNGADYNIIPLNIGLYYPRQDVWWGNSQADIKLQYQNIKNLLINMQIEGTMKLMDRIVLTRRGALDISDLNNRHQYSGIVFTDSNEPLDKIMHQMQFNDQSLNSMDWLNRSIDQQIQENSPIVNLLNRYNEGGMNNQTLGAAQMLANIGESMFALPVQFVGDFIERVSDVNAVLLMQNCGDKIPLRSYPTEDEVIVEKREILGEFVFRSKSTIFVNDKTERINNANIITQVGNWGQFAQSTPQFSAILKNIKLVELFKDWLAAWKGRNSNISDYFDVRKAEIEVQRISTQQPGMAGAASSPAGLPPSAENAPAPGQLTNNALTTGMGGG
jgi:hypothetical protein